MNQTTNHFSLLTKTILTFIAQNTTENNSINSHAQDTTTHEPTVFLSAILHLLTVPLVTSLYKTTVNLKVVLASRP
jgi:hypothetical protein